MYVLEKIKSLEAAYVIQKLEKEAEKTERNLKREKSR